MKNRAQAILIGPTYVWISRDGHWRVYFSSNRNLTRVYRWVVRHAWGEDWYQVYNDGESLGMSRRQR